MKFIRSIFNGKDALNEINLNDVLLLIDDDQRIELQRTLLDMYKDIFCLCKEYGWTPYLVGGSALGAIRHKGFIPWDDDLDIGMLREEYELFLPAFKDRFSDKYTVNAPEKSELTKARFTKILKKDTLFREIISLPNDDLNGVFVDIFPIENVPEGSVNRITKGICCDVLAFISSQVFNWENRNLDYLNVIKRTGMINYYVRILVGSLFSIKKATWWFAKFDSVAKCKDNQSRYCTMASGRKHYFGEFLKRDKIIPPRYVDFCGIKAPVFNDVEAYLSNMYGDYMIIPPEDKREKHFIQEIRL